MEVDISNKIRYLLYMSRDQVILVAIPLEIAWKATVSWWADWLTCKLMVSLRIFGYFLTSNVLMAISMDRWNTAPRTCV